MKITKTITRQFKKEISLDKLLYQVGLLFRNKNISEYLLVEKIIMTVNKNLNQVVLLENFLVDKKDNEQVKALKFFVRFNYHKVRDKAKGGDFLVIYYKELDKNEFQSKLATNDYNKS